MRKRIFLLLFLCGMLLFSACNGQTETDPPQSTENLVGTPTRFHSVMFEWFDTVTQVMGYAESQEEFDVYNAIIRYELQRMHQLFDIYNEYPGLNNIRTINQNAGIAPVAVDPLLIELIEISIEAYHLTDGTVNVALGPVLELWHTHRHAEIPALPAMEALQAANAYTNIQDIVVDRENGTVFLRYENMSLDVGTTGKGFALDFVVRRAQEAGFQSFLINMGGDVLTADPPPGREAWNVGIEDPGGGAGVVDVAAVVNLAVLASGDYRRYFVVDGVAYSHLIDPETLMPATHFRSVSVIHPSAVYAEILSTAIFILEFEAGLALLAAHGAEGVWITADGEILTTPGYSRFSGGF